MLFDQQVHYVLNTLVLESSEVQLQAFLDFKRTGEDTKSPAFAAYRAAKERATSVLTVAGYPIGKLLSTQGALAREQRLRERCRERFAELAAYHREQAAAGEAALKLHDLLRGYKSLVTVLPDLLPANDKVKGEAISIYMGEQMEDQGYFHYPAINALMEKRAQAAKLPEFKYDSLAASKHSQSVGAKVPDLFTPAKYFNGVGYLAFSVVNTDRKDSYEQRAYPVTLDYMRDLRSLRKSAAVLGDAVLWLAHGNGVFSPPLKKLGKTFTGRVYVANVGQSIVPNYPLAGALWSAKLENNAEMSRFGYYHYPIAWTDPYGRYAFTDYIGDIPWSYSPEAWGYGPDGRITLVKDEGAEGQAVYRSMNLSLWTGTAQEVNVVLFRGTAVTLLDLVNPQTLQPYAGVEFVSREGLADLPRKYALKGDEALTRFVEPEKPFFVKLMAGTPESPNTLIPRGFMLGRDLASFQGDPSKEIDGPGYLPADTSLMRETARDIAAAMLQVNGKRLDLQNRYAMADEWTQKYQAKAIEKLDEAQGGTSHHARTLAARESATYSTLNHPVLRSNISQAVVGILWYLGLLVPFCFFFEKLVFGFADIRKQLLTQAVIILVVFALLKFLHPAFEMIRSSLMILLGFLILLISAGITVIFSGKFQENLEELRKQQGKVTAAEINTMGVVGTAFMLGLNNMHRRKVRTGLTCATLVLITFAMICFTSVTSNLQNVTYALGKAPYQGFLIKYPDYLPIAKEELDAIKARYEHLYAVAPRYMYVGHRTWEAQLYNPSIEIVFDPKDATDPAGRQAQKVNVGSLLLFTDKEPLREKILKDMLTHQGWFPRIVGPAPAEPPVMIPDAMAEALRIRPAEVDAVPVPVTINGQKCRVIGIFKAAGLAELLDLDGRPLLPFDAEAIQNPRLSGGNLLASSTDVTIPAERIVLAASQVVKPGDAAHAQCRLASIAIDLENRPDNQPRPTYAQARAVIDQYLEQSGKETFYGLAGEARKGQQARGSSLGGLWELLVPLVVAALTVLNTMRGSVYERRDEIFVYNAVGIAPKYVFFMFFAEAFVYAVVGAVAGYVLSQGLGRILSEAGWTGGLNMTFTSIATILASLAVTASVFISTYFPARSAMKIATPSEEQGWTLPPAEGDAIRFALPFTFDRRDRIAVLAFFSRIFLDHGEGGAGKFYAGKPSLHVEETAGTYVPAITTTIWLKPFDLGVSQELTIRLPVDPETREFIARIELRRLSGTRESWERLNTGFVAILRKHFLYWRAVSPTEREGLFDDARRQLEAQAVASRSPTPTEVA